MHISFYKMPIKIPVKILVLSALVLLALFGGKVALENFLSSRISTWITQECRSCTFNIETLEIGLSPLRIVLGNFVFITGDRSSTELDLRIRRLDILIDIRKIRLNRLTLGKITAFNSNFIVIEGDLKSNRNSRPASKSRLEFILDGIHIVNGKFTYIRQSGKNRAVINISEIDCVVESMGSTPQFKSKVVNARLDGKLEKTGEIKLTVGHVFLSDLQKTKILLILNHINLREMNSYFLPADGVELAGKLVSGIANIEIDGERLNGVLTTKYHLLDIYFNNTKERSEVKSIFQNIVTDLTINKSNMTRQEAQRTQDLEIQRVSQEPIMKFIFRGLKEMALSIITT